MMLRHKSMTKALGIVVLVAFGLSTPTKEARAQRFVQMYFDSKLRTTDAFCPRGPMVDTLYVVAHNFNAYITAIEYRILLPPELVWLGDIPAASNQYSFVIGNTPTGISIGWGLPQNAIESFVLNRILVFWVCEQWNCGEQHAAWVLAHPATGFLRAIRWPDSQFIYADGSVSWVCFSHPVATHQTTWGAVKNLYATGGP